MPELIRIDDSTTIAELDEALSWLGPLRHRSAEDMARFEAVLDERVERVKV